MSSHNPLNRLSVDRLAEVFQAGQRFGWIGHASPESILGQTDGFVGAVELAELTRLVELGSGGGVPGLVIAARLPDLELVCIEADQRRVDHLWWAVNFLELESRVSVVHGRAEDLAHDPAHRGVFDGCIARSFAPLPVTVEVAAGFLRIGGRCIVSRAISSLAGPSFDRGLRLVGQADCSTAADLYVGIQVDLAPARYPRSEKSSRREPLWNVSRET